MAKQLEFKMHGGKRKNAGRKNRTGQSTHKKRPTIDGKKPLHITLKCTPNLQKPKILNKMKEACKRTQDFEMNVLQFSILCDHIHMIVEAKSNDAVTRGIKSLTNKLAKKFGTKFKGRYHMRIITSPRQMKNTYKYVMLNYAKHADLPAHIDGFSTGDTFTHWSKLTKIHGDHEERKPDHYGLKKPETWLADRGWMRAH